jgi:hypothetical protein
LKINHHTQNRNIILSLFESFASIAVIFIHCPLPDKVGTIVTAIARFAVPFFFMITGFYMYSFNNEFDEEQIKNLKNKLKYKILKYLSIFILAYIFYELYFYLLEFYIGNTGYVSLFTRLDRYSFFSLLLFSQSPLLDYSFHLWFLLALIQVYIVFYFFSKPIYNNKGTFLFLWTILFFALEIIFIGREVQLLNHTYKGIILIVNGLVEGTYCSLFGVYLKYLFQKYNLFEKCYFTVKSFIVVTLLLFITSVLERLLLGSRWDIYISSILIAIIFMYITHCKLYLNEKLYFFIHVLTAKCNIYIYILHLVVTKTFNLVPLFSIFPYNYLKPFLAIILTIILSMLALKIQNVFNRKI